jgi:uncharacterized delta-60 repeat protein
MENPTMLLPFTRSALIRGSKPCRAPEDRPGTGRGRRPRSFHGGVEHLEGRTLLSFGTGGIVTTQVNGSAASQAFAVAIQPADQKIVAGGDTQYPNIFALARYNTDGTLDSTFGSKGVVTTTFGNSDYSQVNSILVQPSNGKIVAGGIEYYLNTRTYSYQAQFVLARYTASGSLDSTFGKGGKVTTLYPSYGGYGQAGINTVLL